MKTYDVYGVKEGDLEGVREAIEHALAITFVGHESSYLGDYYLAEVGCEEFKLILNRHPTDGARIYGEGFADYDILLHVDHTLRPEHLQALLASRVPGLILLERESL